MTSIEQIPAPEQPTTIGGRTASSTARVVLISLAIVAAVLVVGVVGSIRSTADTTTVTVDGAVVVAKDELFEVRAATEGTGDGWEVVAQDGLRVVSSTVPRDRPGEPEILTFEVRPTAAEGSLTLRHVGTDGDELERSTIEFVTEADSP